MLTSRFTLVISFESCSAINRPLEAQPSGHPRFQREQRRRAARPTLLRSSPHWAQSARTKQRLLEQSSPKKPEAPQTSSFPIPHRSPMHPGRAARPPSREPQSPSPRFTPAPFLGSSLPPEPVHHPNIHAQIILQRAPKRRPHIRRLHPHRNVVVHVIVQVHPHRERRVRIRILPQSQQL